MGTGGLKLSVHAGERDRGAHGLLADELIEIYERCGVRTSVLLRGVEGFGLRHRLRSDRLLSLSEDLPVVAVALDEAPRVQAALAEVERVSAHGLIALERIELVGAGAGMLDSAPGGARLTLLAGRAQRTDGRATHAVVVESLHRHGLDGASVLVGLDGTLAGRRHRARLLDANTHVPVMVDGVGSCERVAAAAEELSSLLPAAALALERVTICKRDGVHLAEPPPAPQGDAGELSWWQRLVVHAGEQSRHEHEPLHGALVRRLRREGAAGATVLRGHWGFYGEDPPHGERFWSLTRRVPALTLVLDTPANTGRWFEIIDEMTARTGLVTCEQVPALRSGAPGVRHGGVRLAPAVRHGDGGRS
ncbi:MAG TPA: DUF190 domain-containing protein [Solirubrobacteraceae bacterium]